MSVRFYQRSKIMMTVIYFKNLTWWSCSEELDGRLVLLRLAEGLKSLSRWGWQSGRKTGCEAGKKQGQTGTYGDQKNLHLALTIAKLHSLWGWKMKLTFFTLELHVHVKVTWDSEKLKEIWWVLGGCGPAAAPRQPGVPGHQAVSCRGTCCLFFLNLRAVASLPSTTSCENISCN